MVTKPTLVIRGLDPRIQSVCNDYPGPAGGFQATGTDTHGQGVRFVVGAKDREVPQRTGDRRNRFLKFWDK
jgi:hypothetical protein